MPESARLVVEWHTRKPAAAVTHGSQHEPAGQVLGGAGRVGDLASVGISDQLIATDPQPGHPIGAKHLQGRGQVAQDDTAPRTTGAVGCELGGNRNLR